jgi:hypothetical protein
MVSITLQGSAHGVQPDSLSITHTLFQRSTASFTIPDPTGTLNVAVGHSVKVFQDQYLWFAGTVTSADTTLVKGVNRSISINAVDYSQLCDRRLTPDMQWKDTPANTICRELVAASLKGEGTYQTGTSLTFASDGVSTTWNMPEALVQ